MKRIFFIFCMFYVLFSFGQDAKKDAGIVIKHMQEQERFWNSADIKGFMKYYWNSDSLKFIGSKGVTYGWQKTLDNYLKAYPTKEAMGTLSFIILEASTLSENAVYVIGKWDLKKEKAAGGYFTLLWRKIDGKWLIVADHTS